jgi:hypothetical protein
MARILRSILSLALFAYAAAQDEAEVSASGLSKADGEGSVVSQLSTTVLADLHGMPRISQYASSPLLAPPQAAAIVDGRPVTPPEMRLTKDKSWSYRPVGLTDSSKNPAHECMLGG